MGWQFSSERLKMAREGKGLTEHQLAFLIGVTVQQLQQWESGAFKPSQKSFCRFCDVTGCVPTYFFVNSGNVGN